MYKNYKDFIPKKEKKIVKRYYHTFTDRKTWTNHLKKYFQPVYGKACIKY